MPGQRTGFHDHDLSDVGVACVSGELEDGSLAIGRDAHTVRMTPGVSRTATADTSTPSHTAPVNQQSRSTPTRPARVLQAR
jgi:hypothetical protein